MSDYICFGRSWEWNVGFFFGIVALSMYNGTYEARFGGVR